MSRILLLETATEVCSAALAEEGRVLAFAEKSDGYKHAEQLTLFVEQLLTETGMTARDLDAVCVSRGRSYTGLRIGVSTAKGLCYALQIPLLAVSTLDAMAHHVAECRIPDSLTSSDEVLLCPMLDARRMEVYSALYDSKGNQIADISARIIDSQSFEDILANKTIIFFGNGADKCKTQLTSSNAIFLEGVQASARFMSKLAQEHYNNNTREDVSYFEPFYLKDFMATVPRNKIF